MRDAETRLGAVELSPDETWIEFGPPDGRRRVGFHDYAGIYAVPGLYERVFYDTLGMRTAEVVVELFAQALATAGRAARGERVLDLGAGNGIAGAELRRAGVGHVVGLDVEPRAREAAMRDRPGVYDEYLVGDLAAWSGDQLAALRARNLTGLVAVAAIGKEHVPPDVLRWAVEVLEPRGVFAFAVLPELLPEGRAGAGRATGYPELLAELLRDSETVSRREYVHRRRSDGTPEHAVATAGRRRP